MGPVNAGHLSPPLDIGPPNLTLTLNYNRDSNSKGFFTAHELN